MSKYYKAEDLERALIGFIRETSIDEKPYDYAVNVLDDLPTIEVGEDCISREDAVNALIAHFIPQTYTGEEVEQASKLARKIMANAPSVAPRRAEGEWIDMGDFEKCSVCKSTHLKEFQSYYGKVAWVKTPYCPNCGARMKGIDNE